jgi:glycosyltransferase involved in cell wall biosynthesis
VAGVSTSLEPGTQGAPWRAAEVSVIVPAFNEERRLGVALPTLVAHLAGTGAEIVVVDDGSTDRTSAVASRILDDGGAGSVVRLARNAGKGAAVRAGVAVARGSAIVFMDADMATDLAHLPRLVAGLADHDVVIGSRRTAGAVVAEERVRRHMGVAFNVFVRALTGLELGDTQCGFKAFRAHAARQLFDMATTDGYAFDVEVLLLATRLGMSIEECPVRWTAVDGSKVRRLRDPLRMSTDVWRAHRRWPAARVASAVAPAPACMDLTDSAPQRTHPSPAPALAFT